MSKVTVTVNSRKLDQIARIAGENVPARIIADGVEYGVYVELGTSRRSAKPALVPAFRSKTKNLGRMLGQAIERGVSLNDVMSKTAFDIQREYQSGVPVLTGALKNSIKVYEE